MRINPAATVTAPRNAATSDDSGAPPKATGRVEAEAAAWQDRDNARRSVRVFM